MLTSPLVIGDRFRTSINKKGTIIFAYFEFDKRNSYRKYTVKWDHLPMKSHHFHSNVTDEWTKIEDSKGIKISDYIGDARKYCLGHINQKNYEKGFEITPKECQHEWAEYVGFTESYKYCRRCDEKDKS